jgi:type 1 glutamine amidotransferase
VLFYTMLMNGPTDEGLPWYAGRPKTAMEHLGATRQGIVVLHHAILAYPQWQTWNEITGIQDRRFGYHIGQSVTSRVVNPGHPITRGVADWTMVDETYTMADTGPGSEVLLTYEHPRSMRTIAWTRRHRQSRVFCYQAGHDNLTWVDTGFRGILSRGLLWAAGVLD